VRPAHAITQMQPLHIADTGVPSLCEGRLAPLTRWRLQRSVRSYEWQL
jgi:hypothetical protein